jgi:PAT family beta-lactamase induction signal transducer AmpG
VSYPAAAFVAAGVLLALALALGLAPAALVPARPGTLGQALARAVKEPFLRLASRPGFVCVLVFIFAFKLGDFALKPFAKPFWVKKGFADDDLVIMGTLDIAASVAGALVGGALTRKLGTFRALWLLGLAQVLSNLAYATAAILPKSHAVFWSAVGIESFCFQLHTAPFIAFLMLICDEDLAATQYALLSALMALGRPAMAYPSGKLIPILEYPAFFALTAVISLPAFALLPWVRAWIAERHESATSNA